MRTRYACRSRRLRRHKVEHENSDERFAALEERFSGYEVRDSTGGKVGEVDEIFVDENSRPEYVGVKMNPSGVEIPLIPLEAVRVDEGRRTIEVSSLPKSRIEDGPSYGDAGEITPDFEQRVRSYYGLEGVRDPEVDGSSASYRRADAETSYGFAERDAGERDSGLQVTDELRVQRSEEEARVGTRARGRRREGPQERTHRARAGTGPQEARGDRHRAGAGGGPGGLRGRNR